MLSCMTVLVPGTMAEEKTILTAMDFLKEIFDKYADMDDEKGVMSKKELTDLLQRHFGEVCINNTKHRFRVLSAS